MQTRSSHLDSNPSARGKHALKLGPPGVWDRDPVEDATRAKRIADAVQWLSEGKRRHWKYENC